MDVNVALHYLSFTENYKYLVKHISIKPRVTEIYVKRKQTNILVNTGVL